MGVSQRLGVRPAGVASPTDAHRTVVYPGVLPRVVRRNAKNISAGEARACADAISPRRW